MQNILKKVANVLPSYHNVVKNIANVLEIVPNLHQLEVSNIMYDQRLPDLSKSLKIVLFMYHNST